ncbi:MAG: hypothetical protein ACREFV_04865 [Acetobacteraceae bacterium]
MRGSDQLAEATAAVQAAEKAEAGIIADFASSVYRQLAEAELPHRRMRLIGAIRR